MMSHTKRLLWIDDEPNILKSYQRALRNEGFEITTATSGEQAKIILENESFQVVISDFRMPGMNGLEILKYVKEKDPDAIRVILSGYADEAAVDKALKDHEIAKYLLKPIENELIRKEIFGFFELYSNSLTKKI